MNKSELTSYFDHTNLNPDATEEDIKKLCDEAIKWNFGGICIHPSRLSLASDYLESNGYDGEIATVIGFPLGANTTEAKVFEMNDAISKGATELDVVINIGKLKDGEVDYVLDELTELVDKADPLPVKVIIETCYLDQDEKIKAIELVNQSQASYIKTSTGFGPKGATLDDVKLMRQKGRADLKIKPAGGIRTLEDAKAYIKAGANRIGASSSVKIVKEIQE